MIILRRKIIQIMPMKHRKQIVGSLEDFPGLTHTYI